MLTENIDCGLEISGDISSTGSSFSVEYAAGFFDGEGCVRVQRTKDKAYVGGIHVFITNTYLPILEEFKKHFGGSVTLRNKRSDKHKAQWQWRISNKREALNFLLAIYPFIIEKSEQVRLGIEFCKLPDLRVNRFSNSHIDVINQRAYRKNIADKLSELKHRQLI